MTGSVVVSKNKVRGEGEREQWVPRALSRSMLGRVGSGKGEYRALDAGLGGAAHVQGLVQVRARERAVEVPHHHVLVVV